MYTPCTDKHIVSHHNGRIERKPKLNKHKKPPFLLSDQHVLNIDKGEEGQRFRKVPTGKLGPFAE